MILVNGEPRALDGLTIVSLLERIGLPQGIRGIAVAVDGEVVSRSEWTTVAVPGGASVEVLHALQGG
jgi:sulfur carrier protein